MEFPVRPTLGRPRPHAGELGREPGTAGDAGGDGFGVEQLADEGRADDDGVRETGHLRRLRAVRHPEADADRQVGAGADPPDQDRGGGARLASGAGDAHDRVA